MAQTTGQQLLDIGERTVFTAGEAILAVYLAKGMVSVSAVEVAILTAISAAIAAVKTIVSQWLGQNTGPKEWLEDMASRAVFTFGETLVAALITSAATDLNLSSIKAAAIAAAAAALSALKSAIANGVNSGPDSPAALLKTSS
jgi:hypothetical protein